MEQEGADKPGAVRQAGEVDGGSLPGRPAFPACEAAAAERRAEEETKEEAKEVKKEGGRRQNKE